MRNHDFDAASIEMTGRLDKHINKPGDWLVLGEKYRARVAVHPQLQEEFEANPEAFSKPCRLLGWVRWNWDDERIEITLHGRHQRNMGMRPNVIIRGLVTRLEDDRAEVLITPSKGKADPFVVPVSLDELHRRFLSVGERAEIRCNIRQQRLVVRGVQRIESAAPAIAS